MIPPHEIDLMKHPESWSGWLRLLLRVTYHVGLDNIWVSGRGL